MFWIRSPVLYWHATKLDAGAMNFALQRMDFVFEMMDFVLQMMEFALQNDEFCVLK